MSIARTSVRSARALHTSTRLLAESNSASTASSLGFGDYSNRTRKLPSIPIAASSKQNLLKPRPSNTVTSPKSREGANGRDNRGPRRQTGECGGEQNAQRRKRQDRSPVQASLNKARQERQPKPSEDGNEEGEGGDEFFAGSIPSRPRGNAGGKGNKMKKVDIDLSSAPVNVNVNVNASRTRSPRSSGSNDKRIKAAPKAKETRVAEVEDRSPAGIFGRMSLLFPIRRGAREAERSVWADGLKPDQARKSELERLAGSPSVYLPSKPIPTQLTGSNAVQSSRILSEWLLATNPGISMRRAKTGQAIIKGYLK